MPYREDNDEFYWPKEGAPRMNGSDYKNYESKRLHLSDAYRTLLNHFSLDQMFNVTVTGKLYKGRSKISAVSRVMSLSSFFEVAQQTRSGQVTTGTSPTPFVVGFTTEDKIARLFDLDPIPEHIASIHFQALD